MTEQDKLLAFHQAINKAPLFSEELSTKDFHTLFAAVTAGSEGCYYELGEIEAFLIIPKEIVSFDSPEENYMKKEAFEKLSDDCRFIIELVIEGPSETFQMFLTDQQKRPTKTKIRTYLWKHEHWIHTRIDDAFNELGCFISIFE